MLTVDIVVHYCLAYIWILLLFFLIIGILVKLNVHRGIIIRLFLRFNILEFLAYKLLLTKSVITERFILITLLSVSFDNVTQICLAVIYVLHNLYFCIVITQDTHIQRKRLKLF